MEHCVASKLLDELKAMIIYTADKGDPIPAEIMPTVHQMEGKLADESSPGLAALTADELHHLAAWHNQMAGLVAPASPRSIYLMQQPASGFLSFLGPLSIVKQLTFLSMFFLVLTVGLALSNDVNRVTINQGIFDSAGIVLFLNLMFLLACAGLGATFSSLHQVFGYINDSTFDPKYNATYLIKIIMGLISGLMMAELIPLDSFADQDSPIRDLDKPLIALLGGFSSDLPYRILSRLLEVIEQLFGKNLSKPPQVKATGASNLPKGATLDFDMPDLSKDKSESEKEKEVPTKAESKPKNLTSIGAPNKVTEAKAGSNKEG